MTVMILQVVVIGVEGGLNIGVQNGIRRQLKARGPVWGPTGPSLCSQHSKLKGADIGAYTGFKKSFHRNHTRDFGARYTVEYDSVLSQ